MNPYVSLLIMAGLALLVAVGGLTLSAVVSPTPTSAPATAARLEHGRFPVAFYLVGMTFIVFDVEVVFLYPWVTAFGRLGVFGLGAALLFIAIITVPYVLEWRRGALDWD